MDPTQQLNSEQPQHQNPPQDKLHPMVVLRPGERVICEIKRHPFGILSMYFSGALAIIVAFTLAAIAPNIIQSDTDITMPAFLAASILSVGIACILWIATSIYWQNRWIVTDDSVTQIIQDGLFGRRVSQLSMESLEDVSVDQHGIIQSMFNFGTLKAETAGEHSKFQFPYCPNPNAYARKILEVHETFLHQSRHQPQQVNPVVPMNEDPYRPQQTQQYQHPIHQPQPTTQEQQWQQPAVHPQGQAMPQVPRQTPAMHEQHYAPQQYAQPAPLPPHFPGQPQQDQHGQTKSPAIWGD